MSRATKLAILLAWCAIATLIACRTKSDAPAAPKLGAAPTQGTEGTENSGAAPLGCKDVPSPTKQTTVRQCEQATDWIGVPDNGTGTIWTYDISQNDDLHLAADVSIETAGGTTVYDHAQLTVAFGGAYAQVDGGALSYADPTGSTSTRVTYSNAGSSLNGSSVAFVLSGNTVALQVSCVTTGAYCTAKGSVSTSKGSQPFAVLSVSPSTVNTTVASDTTITITTTPGGALLANAASLGTTALRRCSATSNSTATCLLLAGTYAAGTGDVCLGGPQVIPICLPSGFTFSSSDAGTDSGADAADAADASDAADSADAADAGPAPTLDSLSASIDKLYQPATPTSATPKQLLTGTNLTVGCTATVCGTSATAVCNGSNQVTITWPTNAVQAAGTYCDLVVTTPSGSATLASTVGVLPAAFNPPGYVLYAGQGWSTGTPWIDISSGYTGTVATGGGFAGFVAPAQTTSWNGSVALTFTTTTDVSVPFNDDAGTNHPLDPTQGFDCFSIADYSSIDTGTASFIYDSNDAGGRFLQQFDNANHCKVGNGFQTLTSGTSCVANTAYFTWGDSHGSDSGVSVNNGSKVRGFLDAGSGLVPGAVIGSHNSGVTPGHFNLIGHVGMVGCTSSGTFLSDADLAVLDGFRSTQW